jgi:hypothetical protein
MSRGCCSNRGVTKASDLRDEGCPLDPRLRGDDTTSLQQESTPVIPTKLVPDLTGKQESMLVIPAKAGIQESLLPHLPFPQSLSPT